MDGWTKEKGMGRMESGKGMCFCWDVFGGLIDTMLCGGHGIEKYGKIEGIFSWSFHEKKVKMDGKIL
jgi:hypothetical protein